MPCISLAPIREAILESHIGDLGLVLWTQFDHSLPLQVNKSTLWSTHWEWGHPDSAPHVLLSVGVFVRPEFSAAYAYSIAGHDRLEAVEEVKLDQTVSSGWLKVEIGAGSMNVTAHG